MAKDRARDDRRSVGSHAKMMGALGKAAGWTRYEDPSMGTFAIPADKNGSPKLPATVGPGKDSVVHVGHSTAARYNSKDAVLRANGVEGN